MNVNGYLCIFVYMHMNIYVCILRLNMYINAYFCICINVYFDSLDLIYACFYACIYYLLSFLFFFLVRTDDDLKWLESLLTIFHLVLKLFHPIYQIF